MKKIRSNPRYKKLLEDVSSGVGLDTEKILTEMETLHRSRDVRTLDVNTLFSPKGTKKIAQAVLQNQAFRSRILELKLSVTKRRSLVEIRRDLTVNYIRYKYKEELQDFRTAAERDAAVAALFEPIDSVVMELYRVETFGDEIISDIDKAAWSLKSLLDSLNLETRA